MQPFNSDPDTDENVSLSYTTPIHRLRKQSSLLKMWDQHSAEMFLAISNHELKNPLTAIRVQAQLGMKYVKRNDPDLITSAFQTIETQTHRMEQLIKDLLDVSKMQDGTLEMHPIPINFTSFCRQMVQVQQTVYRREFLVNIPDEPITIFADSNRIRQVMINLITNAIKYSSPKSPLELSLHHDANKNQVILSLQNMGIAIPIDELPVIFEQFYRATSA
ncbi:MAG: HAMP domain-containing histidine kinase, partial [Chloroflexota bacterium]|nr:HAMP domain-containing histidine kinase [Chloroflexota bacterium]